MRRFPFNDCSDERHLRFRCSRHRIYVPIIVRSFRTVSCIAYSFRFNFRILLLTKISKYMFRHFIGGAIIRRLIWGLNV